MKEGKPFGHSLTVAARTHSKRASTQAITQSLVSDAPIDVE